MVELSIEAARALYDTGGGGHDFDHVLRVVALAERIAVAEGADLAVVRTAALLHDIGESEGRADHHLRGAAMARDLLRAEPPEFVEAVAHAIAAHRYRSAPNPESLEAKVVSDADKLDALGAIGIARVFAYAGARGTPLYRLSWHAILAAAAPPQDTAAVSHPASEGPDLPLRRPDVAREPGQAGQDLAEAMRHPAGGAYTPVHEFVYKLRRIPERLYTPAARAIAAERQAFMQAFFDRLDAEAAGQR